MIRRLPYIIVFLFTLVEFQCNAHAQLDSTELIEYTVNYKFKDGIFLTYHDFRNNNPISFTQTNLPSPKQMKIESSLMETSTLEYFDKFGNRKEIDPKTIWGYAYKGKTHIQWQGYFNMLTYIGTYSHFLGQIMVYHSAMNDPYYNPYYTTTNATGYTSQETYQLVLNTKTGEIMNLTIDNIKHLLSEEPELLKDFESHNKRKQRKLLFYYIHQYNEKHPIYFPKN